MVGREDRGRRGLKAVARGAGAGGRWPFMSDGSHYEALRWAKHAVPWHQPNTHTPISPPTHPAVFSASLQPPPPSAGLVWFGLVFTPPHTHTHTIPPRPPPTHPPSLTSGSVDSSRQ